MLKLCLIMFKVFYSDGQLAHIMSSLINEMASKAVHTSESSGNQHQSKTWISLADRGGLYHVSNTVFNLFVVIEMKTNEELSTIFQRNCCYCKWSHECC